MPAKGQGEDAGTSSHAGRGSSAGQRARQRQLGEYVIKRGTVSIDDLVAMMGVSTMTIYRDVAALEEAGLVQRQRGQVVASASSLQEASASFRLEQNAATKQAMARALAPRIVPGSSLMLDDSTSGVWVLRALEGVSPLTVVTNSLLVTQELERRDDVRLFVTGGEYQAWARSMMGAATVSVIESMHVDFCVVSASGIVDGQCQHPYEDVARVKRAMLQQARTKVLVADHTKFARRALHTFAKLEEFDLVVVDAAAGPELLDAARRAGVEVVVAEG